MSSINALSAKQLYQAAKIKEKIDELEKELAKLLGSVPEPVESQSKPRKKRGPKKGGMSAAGRARIAAAQKARWAKVRAAKGGKAKK